MSKGEYMNYHEIRKHIVAAVITEDIDPKYATIEELDNMLVTIKLIAFEQQHTELTKSNYPLTFDDWHTIQ